MDKVSKVGFEGEVVFALILMLSLIMLTIDSMKKEAVDKPLVEINNTKEV